MKATVLVRGKPYVLALTEADLDTFGPAVRTVV